MTNLNNLPKSSAKNIVNCYYYLGLDQDMEEKLEIMLREQIEGMLGRIDEEE